MVQRVLIYADGGVNHADSAGSAGFVVEVDGRLAVRAAFPYGAAATNQMMEIWACSMALEKVAEGVESPFRPKDSKSVPEIILRSDSAYVVNCLQKGWYVNWMLNGWKNSSQQPVANEALWRGLLSRVRGVHDRLAAKLGPSPWRRLPAGPSAAVARRSLTHGLPVTIEKVKGHSGDRLNEEADAMATLAKNGHRFLEEQPWWTWKENA